MLDNTGKTPEEILKGVKESANSYFKSTQLGKKTKDIKPKKIKKIKKKG